MGARRGLLFRIERLEQRTLLAALQLDNLIRLTERYCVVYQTLRQPPAMQIVADRG